MDIKKNGHSALLESLKEGEVKIATNSRPKSKSEAGTRKEMATTPQSRMGKG